MSQPLLAVSSLTRRFGGLVAVSDVTFDVAAGEIAGLIGPNGAGKTTLFNMLAGATPPSGGRITFNGADCTGAPAHAMARRGVARTFQITSLFPGLTTFDNIVAAAYRTGRTGWGQALLRTPAYRAEEAKAAERARDILAFVDLDRHADVLADELSYGEQRRLEIAIALAAEPTLLLLDEPAAGMNPEEGQRLVAMIRQIRDRGVTVLLVEHHMRVVMAVCHRVIVIDHGVKIAEGPPAEIVPPEMSGRAITAVNFAHFTVSFAFQWGIGAVLRAYPAVDGRYASEGYTAALLAIGALQLAALAWLLPLRASAQPVRT